MINRRTVLGVIGGLFVGNGFGGKTAGAAAAQRGKHDGPDIFAWMRRVAPPTAPTWYAGVFRDGEWLPRVPAEHLDD